MGECSEKQFVSVCVCARVFIFPGHVFFHATVSSPKKQVPNCTRVDWDKLADCPCSGQQRLAEMLESLSGTTGCRRNRKNAMCWQGAKEPQCVGVGVGDSHRMLSFNSNRSSQQDTEQGTITDVLGLHMLTSTLDCFFCKITRIHGETVTMSGRQLSALTGRENCRTPQLPSQFAHAGPKKLVRCYCYQ